MADPVGDAGAVEQFAVACRRQAKRLNEIQHGAEARVKSTHWVGNSATRVGTGVKAQRRPVNSAADELERLAKVLDKHAAWIRTTIAELEDLETRIRAWALAHPADPASAEPDASWITTWPVHHGFEWRDVARQLQAFGAVF